MSLNFSQINLRKNILVRLNNSNKNIFFKKLSKKEPILNTTKEVHEKIEKKINNYKPNTSVKKIKHVKKININDYVNQCSLLKNGNSNNKEDKSLFVKTNTIIKMKNKFEKDNKENLGINFKEKIEKKKLHRKSLKKIFKDNKLNVEQNTLQNINSLQLDTSNKTNENKLSTLLKDIQNDLNKDKSEQKLNLRNSINSNGNNLPKEVKNNDKTFIISPNTKNIIENGKIKGEGDEKLESDKLNNISHDDDIEYIFKYHRNKISEKTHIFNTDVIPNKTKKFIGLRKDYTKLIPTKNEDKAGSNYNHKKINLDTPINSKITSSININEKENGKNYIKLINNLDVIKIISKKEQKKIIRSTHNNSKEISTENFIKQNPTLIKKFKLNGLNLIYNDESTEKGEKKIKNEDLYKNKTRRNINPLHKSIHYINSKNNTYLNDINEAILKNDKITNTNILPKEKIKKYFVPKDKKDEESKNEIDTLVNTKTNNKNQNQNYKKINKDKNPKLKVNFGANNQKKREILFNFNEKKIKIDDNRCLSFHSKRKNSLINKRNKHITERNKSISINYLINDSYKYNLNQDVDLDIPKKKLTLIRSEINKYKFRKKLFNISNNCSFSINQITENNLNKKKEEIDNQTNANNIIQRNKINKRYKTFQLKLNSLNVIKNINDNFVNGEKVVIKRGDLLNKLRKIKHNYDNVEISSIN